MSILSVCVLEVDPQDARKCEKGFYMILKYSIYFACLYYMSHVRFLNEYSFQHIVYLMYQLIEK